MSALRPLNLAMIALSLYLARQFVVLKVLQDDFRQAPALNDWQFCILVIATLCIAAAGYLLNDYFDKAIDHVNHPEKRWVGDWGERTILRSCLCLDLLGIGLGYLTAYMAGNLHLGFIFVLAAALLLVYSRYLKRIVLAGNITVALLSALVILLPGIIEPGLIHPPDLVYHQAAVYIWPALIGYAGFAFVSTMIREIIKDTEDMQGDRIGGRKTLPILMGDKSIRFVIINLLLAMVWGLVIVQKRFIVDGNLFFTGYIAIAIEIPAVAGMILAYRANSIKDYSRLSLLMKVIMLTGIMSMVFYKAIL